MRLDRNRKFLRRLQNPRKRRFSGFNVQVGRQSVMQMGSVHHWVRANKSVTCSFSTS